MGNIFTKLPSCDECHQELIMPRYYTKIYYKDKYNLFSHRISISHKNRFCKPVDNPKKTKSYYYVCSCGREIIV